jgi:outer membrane scaffolding protein for murein synthesis (MipA/OmpV family)
MNLFSKTLAACLCLAAGAAWADKPLWEIGAGAAFVDFATYRGSDQYKSYVLPSPYVVYRGKFLQVDREKIRGLLFKSDWAELDISVNGSVPVKSSDTPARAGMPDLDPTLELGPSLNLTLAKSADGNRKLDLRLPVRYAWGSDFSSIHGVGWLFQPQLNLDVTNMSALPGWNLGLLTGPIFADKAYHQYFYGVDPQYATASRPAYQARGGYAGMQFIAALSKRYPDYWVGGFVKLDDLHGAVFADSPLVRTRTNVSGGFAVCWIFAKSRTLVPADD